MEQEIDFQATEPLAEGRPPRPSHDPRPFDGDVEEARWRDLPPAPPAAHPAPLPAPVRPTARTRPRVRWWLLVLLVTSLAAGALQLLPSEPPPCGENMFIPSTGDQPGCVDPKLLHQAGR